MDLELQNSTVKSHQKPHMLRRNLWPFLTLMIVTAICWWLVQHFKKPGQMSVIESQAMDMSAMQPTRGAVPVAIATVKEQQIEGTVTYTGSVQAYEDEDIYSRITGRIVAMPVYPGDRVKKGQLLVQLDPPEQSEYSAKLAETRFAADAAMHNSNIAREELTEKAFNLDAAKAAEMAAIDELQQAKSDLEYWAPEIKREEHLLQAQVISQQEFDDESNKFRQAASKVKQLEAKLQQAKSARLASNAASEAAAHHVGHIVLAAREAGAAQQFANIIDSYTRIIARSDGIVTKRLISPGVVVNPGMLILKISHLKQVRIQAEVAADDANKIDVGNTVYIKGSDDASEEITAKITSIFPAADASTKTVIVEALIDNVGPKLSKQREKSESLPNLSSLRMLPGEYVVMRISVGKKDALTIPSTAVVWREGKAQVWKAVGGSGGASGAKYTCIMHPEIKEDKPGKCPKCSMDLVPTEASGTLTSQLVEVKTGLSDDQNIEVISGLSAGDKVIYEGYANLQNGIAVIGTDWGQSGPIKLPEASSVQSNRLDSSNNWTNDLKVEDLDVHLSMLPNPPKGGNNSLFCTVRDSQKKLVTRAAFTAKTSMPTMSMAGPDLSANDKGEGKYEFASNFMSGLWEVKLRINDKTVTINVEVP